MSNEWLHEGNGASSRLRSTPAGWDALCMAEGPSLHSIFHAPRTTRICRLALSLGGRIPDSIHASDLLHGPSYGDLQRQGLIYGKRNFSASSRQSRTLSRSVQSWLVLRELSAKAMEQSMCCKTLGRPIEKFSSRVQY